DDVIDHLDDAARLDCRRLGERHRKQRPREHEHDQHDRAEELAETHRHGLGAIAGVGARLYGPQRRRCQPNHRMTSLAPPLKTRPRAVRLWLLAVATLIFATVIVGGATRLTESGLSIVEWKPVTGVIPPFHVPAWQAEFEKYKTIPQYR